MSSLRNAESVGQRLAPREPIGMTVLVIVETLLAAVGMFLALRRIAGASSGESTALAWGVLAAAAVVGGVIVVLLARGRRLVRGSVPLAIAASITWVMALGTLYQVSCYLSIPADILSFAESNYVADIIRFSRGEGLFSRPGDNNSYPYSPGSQLVTYAVARALGRGDSVPWLRYVQFSYVVAAAAAATAATDCLARKFAPPSRLAPRPLWWSLWLPALFLLCTEPRFNLYTHSLHNDGLALLVSMLAAWMLAGYALRPQGWLLGWMVVLPAAGFMVKQNQLLWGGVFVLYFLVSGQLRWRSIALLAAGMGLVLLATIAICERAWGEPYWYWVIEALGGKQISLARSLRHLLMCGLYANLGLAAGWALVLRPGTDRVAVALWLTWLLPFGLAAFTSGLGYQTNHLGPGVVLAGGWALAALAVHWPQLAPGGSLGLYYARTSILSGGIVLALGGMGFLREPVNPVPADVGRYIEAIEGEFSGLPPEQVLLDAGSWVYVPGRIVMKDRSPSVSVHGGDNQPEVSHQYLADTIARLRAKTYRRVLAREIDTQRSWYDFNNRGTGVKQALLENYHEVRRIPGVEVDAWWPKHLLTEVVVLEPNDSASGASTGSTEP